MPFVIRRRYGSAPTCRETTRQSLPMIIASPYILFEKDCFVRLLRPRKDNLSSGAG